MKVAGPSVHETKEEREWRPVMFQWLNETPLNYWVRGSLMVPYLELDIRGSLDPFVEKVIVGPNPHQKQTARSIEGLIKLNKWDWVTVKCSKVPYRGM